MSKVTIVYRIISYILVIFAGLFGLMDVVMLFASIVNPLGLISVAILGSVVAYSFTSFYFSLRAIPYDRGCKPSLQTWIRVTGILTIIFAVYNLISTIALLGNPALLSDYYKQMVKMQPSLKSSGVTEADIMQMVRGVIYVFEVYLLLLLLHVTITFGLVKKYAYLFGKEDNGPRQKDDLL